jgi:DNA polymerase-3 subunit beta
MKIVILQEKIKEGLQIVERICSKSLSLPILNNILLKAEKNFIVLEATDLELGIKWDYLTKIEEEGMVVLPSKVLSSFINFLPSKPITFLSKDQALLIECENYKTKIKTLNHEEFPLLPKITEEESFFINTKIFCQSLSQIVDFSTLSTTKPEISGIYFSFKKDQIIMTATDTFRLGEKKIFFKTPSSLTKEYIFILPQKTARELINIFGEKEGEIKIYFTPNQVLFEFSSEEVNQPKISLISRLIEGEFPNYQEIIPKKYETQLILPKNEFLNQIKIAAIFSGKTNEIKFKITPKDNKIELFSQSPDLGEHQSSLTGKMKGKAINIAFNSRFLIDGILNIKSQDIIFELNGEDQAGVLKPSDDQSYIYIVMPIKIS